MSDRYAALPTHFPFFHVGHVELLPADADTGSASDSATDAASLTMIGFRLDDGLGGWLVLGVPESADFSMYCELGNIVASRYAGRTGQTISPPERLGAVQALRLLRHASGPRRTYRHAFEGGIVSVETWIVSADHLGGVGHA